MKSATTKKQMTTLPKTKELPNALFPLISSSPLLGHKFKANCYIALECMPYLNIVYGKKKKIGIKKTEAKNLTNR